MDQPTPNALRRPFEMLFSAALVLIVLAGCGDGDEEGETAFEDADVAETVEEADVAETDEDIDVIETVEDADIAAEATEPPEAEIPDVAGEVAATPADRVVAVADGTPIAAERDATPTPAIVVSAPPVEVATDVPPEAATPAGTAPVATPAVTATVEEPVVDEGTPGIPSDEAVGALEEVLAVAESCTVETFPAYEGDAPVQVTTADVNFRAGPGTDCELISEPLPPGTTVEVLSEPVSREGQPDFEWVAVSVNGTQGWIATDFIEPAP
ncbi:MAG TPA: SH3 domain-containing protein [Thermomicrobiales bacterium]|nr:SH3 domain-containing protein [Thermomicrobiales bacterium]